MKTVTKALGALFLALLHFVIVGVVREELPHGHPTEELVEKRRGAKARIHCP
jgi:hypothetical protein